MEKEITLIGAGPVGSLLAIALSKRGLAVKIFERRPDMRKTVIPAGRSINLAVSVRGIHAMKEVGAASEVLKHAIPMKGRRMHAVDGSLTFQAYGKDETQYINAISRGELNKTLMTLAEGEGVEIIFDQRVIGIDFSSKQIEIEDEITKKISKEKYAKLIATDGSGSVVRRAMADKFRYENSESLLDYGYKELVLPAGTGGIHLLEKNALHIWPRGKYMFIALPNFDGSFTCTLFLPMVGDPSFERLRDRASVEEFFGKQFSDAKKVIPDLADQFFENPTGSMVTVRSRPWNVVEDVCLVGDAAHAIVPFFGQGMNCGFEDVTLLMQMLDKQGWDGLFSDFSSARKADADAIAEMAIENFIEMRDKVAHPEFLLQKEIEKRLLNEFPEDFYSRYQLVTFSRVPYGVAKEVGLASDNVLGELSRGIKNAKEVDISKAENLIQKKVKPLLPREVVR